MLTSSDLIIVDADALIAIFDANDAHATTALAVTRKVVDAHATLLYPATALTEAVTTFQRKLNNPQAAAQVIAAILAKQLLVELVDQTTLDAAMRFFNPHGSKQNTLFDAIVAAIARERGARAVFSFDGWYRKLGLSLVADIAELGASNREGENNV